MATENRHDATRYQICRWCCVKVGNKGKIATLTGQTRQLYIKYFEPIDDTDNYRPLVVCVMCKLYLARASMGSPPKKFPSRFPWPTLLATRFNTCSFLKYNTGGERCALCVQKLHDLVHEEKHHKQSVIQASDGLWRNPLRSPLLNVTNVLESSREEHVTPAIMIFLF